MMCAALLRICSSVQREKGEDRFYDTFYKGFLRSLFHDGLNSPRHERDFQQKYGRIPYLNGGMFDEHELEKKYPDLDISDEAFIGLFAFFDNWNWHLDDRLTASGRDINPDVLDKIDILVAKHYLLTDEELDFILNFDIKYRMGDELNNDER